MIGRSDDFRSLYPLARGSGMALFEVRVQSSDATVVAAVRPGRSPTIVLLHGLASNSAAWQGVIGHLRCRNAVVAVDLPGHGRSTPVADYSYSTLAGVVRDVTR